MKNQSKNNIKMYLKQVSSALNCKFTLKCMFIRELKHNIADTYINNNFVTMELLCQTFGTPEEIASAFFDREDYNSLLRKANKKFIVSLAVSVVLLCALALSVAVIHNIYEMIGGSYDVIID